MKITDVRMKLMPDQRDKIKAWTSVEIDKQLAIRDIKVIDAGEGLFISMPCRKTTDRCPTCQGKNQNTARFCNWCGTKLAENRVRNRADGRPDLWHDIAFPTCPELRSLMEDTVLDEYERQADGGGYDASLRQFVEEGGEQIQRIESRYGE